MIKVRVLRHYGQDAHHEIEAIFKSFARALDAAPRLGNAVPSTKGRIET